MKKIGAIFCLLALCLSLTACHSVKKDIVGTFCAIFSDREYTFYDDGTASYEALTTRGHYVGEGTYKIKNGLIEFEGQYWKADDSSNKYEWNVQFTYEYLYGELHLYDNENKTYEPQ